MFQVFKIISERSLYPDRQMIKADPSKYQIIVRLVIFSWETIKDGKALKDEDSLAGFVKNEENLQLYFKDLGNF